MGPPYSVAFTDTSAIPAGTTVTGILWNFGDGQTSTKKNPVHAYAEDGSYTVGLRITSSCGAPKIKTKPVLVECRAPVAGISIDKTSGPAPLTVHITDQSQNTDSTTTSWIYGNYVYGLPISRTEYRDPPHTLSFTYDDPGSYTITQEVRRDCAMSRGYSKTMRTITVTEAATDAGSGSGSVYTIMNFTGLNVSPTTTVTTTVTPTITTTSYDDSSPVVSTTTVPAAAAPDLPSPIITAAAPSSGISAGTPALAPAQNPPATGTLSVVTSPAGARVFVDDVMRGLSPANIPELAAGQHMLRLEKSGYRTLTVPVSIGDGRTTDYSTALEAESGSMGMVPVIAAVLAIAVIAGAAVFYLRKNPPAKGEQK